MANSIIQKIFAAAGLPLDSNQVPIQAPSKFSCTDGTGTPVTFPITISSGSVTTLVPPANAVALVLKPVGGILRVSSEVAAVTSKYDKIADGGSETYACAGHSAIYLMRDTAWTGVVNGHWRLIGS